MLGKFMGFSEEYNTRNDLNCHNILPVGAVGLSVDSPICTSVVLVRVPDLVQLVVSLGRTLSSHCPAVLQTALSKAWGHT